MGPRCAAPPWQPSTHLSTAAFSLRGALNDSWQVKNLDRSPLVVQDAGHTGQRCELVGGRFRMRLGYAGQKRGLSHGGKADKSHPSISVLDNFEFAVAAASLLEPNSARKYRR